MKLSFIITVATLALLLTCSHVSGQTTCSCQAPDRKLGEDGKWQGCQVNNVTCRDGCTALCGTNDGCYSSCRIDILSQRISMDFVGKTGTEIASLLSDRTHKKIEFVPSKRHTLDRYSFSIKNDDIYNILSFLNKRGKVKVNDVDFAEFERMRNAMTKGRKQ